MSALLGCTHWETRDDGTFPFPTERDQKRNEGERSAMEDGFKPGGGR